MSTCVSTAPSGKYGETCRVQADCKNGLICSTLGTYTGVCLYDKDMACSTTNDCANLLTCQHDGKCGCLVSFIIFNIYNQKSQRLDVCISFLFIKRL